MSCETVDLGIGRLIKAIKAANGILVVSADHGNADDMYQRNKKGEVLIDADTGKPEPKTSHSLNPVPVYVFDPAGSSKAKLAEVEAPGISNLAATCINLLGYEAPEGYTDSLVDV